jgi:hypothetical protein
MDDDRQGLRSCHGCFGATIIKSLLIELYIQGVEGLVLYTVVLGFELKGNMYVFKTSEFIFFIFFSCYIALGFHSV